MTPDRDPRAGETACEALPAADTAPRRWTVEALCGAAGEATIVHKGEEYRLRVTSRGRLILTK